MVRAIGFKISAYLWFARSARRVAETGMPSGVTLPRRGVF